MIKPEDGYWCGGVFEFKFAIPADYPFTGPKVTCADQVHCVCFCVLMQLVWSDLAPEHRRQRQRVRERAAVRMEPSVRHSADRARADVLAGQTEPD